MLATENLQLIRRVQGGQVGLKFGQFWQPTGAFWDAGISVKLLSVDALPGKTLTEGVPVAASHVVTVVAMAPCPHGHDGAGAAQLIFVFDLNDRLLSCTVLLKGAEPHIALFPATAGGWHSDHHHVHLQTPVGVEFLVGVQFPRQGIKQFIDVPVPGHKIRDQKVSRPESMREAMGVYGQVQHVMGTGINLVANGVVQRLHEVHPQVVRGSCFTVLFQDSVILGVVHRVPPTAAPTNPLQLKGEERTQSSTYLFSAVQGSDQSMVPLIILAGEIVFFNGLVISLHVVWSCSVERMI